MPSFSMHGIPIGEGEIALARIWLALEKYGLRSPGVAVAPVSDRCIDIRLTFWAAADVERVLDAIRPWLNGIGATVTRDRDVRAAARADRALHPLRGPV